MPRFKMSQLFLANRLRTLHLTVLRLADESLSVAGSSLAYIQTKIAVGSLSIALGPLLVATVLDYEISEDEGGRKSDEIQVRPQTIVHALT